MIDHQRLTDLLRYEPETGLFWWRSKGSGRKFGVPAGAVQKTGEAKGYVYICVDYQKYRAHRLAWYYVHGVMPEILDHIDGNRSNNAIHNLRPVTQRQNTYNAALSSRNTSGFKGVCWDRSKRKWMASIRTPTGRQRTIGRFDTAAAAAAAHRRVESEYRGEYARPFSNPDTTA